MENSLEHSEVSIEPLDSNLYDKALVFLENIFTREQNIPKELIPLSSETQRWWCIRSGDEILGIAAAWMTNSEWHWGRFSIDEKLRGKGLGTKLVIKSFSDLFEHDTDVYKWKESNTPKEVCAKPTLLTLSSSIIDINTLIVIG